MNVGDEVAGRYRLEELTGRGPMSEVWRAHDDTLDRTVALKMLGPTADLERFRREARAVASLAHEHVMRVYDYGEDEHGGPFMALEWLPGGTLEERLREAGALPTAAAGSIAAGIASGLAHLHDRGFVHRDLKPANVLFDEEDRVKLADFGLARSAHGPGSLTEAGTVLGTAAYLSPEQASGEPATPASDVYSFGVLLFRMLTGTLPFVADDALALVDMHRNRPAPPVASVNPAADPALAALADASLAKDPAARPADGAALLAALGGAPVVAAADMSATRVLPRAAPVAAAAPSRRNAVAVALALVLLAALGALLAWAITRPPTAPSGIVTTNQRRSTTRPFRSTDYTTGNAPTTQTTTSQATTQTTQATSTQATSTEATSTQAPPTTQPPTTTAPGTTTTPSTTVTTGTTATTAPATTAGGETTTT